MNNIRTFDNRSVNRRRGASLFMITFTVSVLATLSLSMVVATNSIADEKQAERHQVAALYAAEAGIAEAVFSLNSGGTGTIASAAAPSTLSGARFWVEETPAANGMKTLTATGFDNQGDVRLELTVRKDNQSIWTWGAFGDEAVTMDSNSHVDSYDSTLGTYLSQQVNAGGNGAYANANGDIGSNGDIDVMQNAEVHGNAVCGPSSATTVTGNATVSGTTAPNTSVVALPSLVIPNIPQVSNLITANNANVVIGSGDHGFDDFELGTGATLTVIGPARIVVNDFELLSNSTMTINAAGGGVEIYVRDDFIMNSKSSLASTTFTPADIALSLESDNIVNPTQNVQLAEVTLESNSVLSAMLFAPNASVDIDSNFELYGAVVARQLHLDSSARVHYDEALANVVAAGTSSGWKAVSWRKVGISNAEKANFYP